LKVVKSIQELALHRIHLKGSVGFVPTMGALHQGHLSLVKKCKDENDVTVCSIFVNPIQFNNPQDFEKYPQTLEQDLDLLEKVNCDLVFVPTAKEMYPTLPKLQFDFGSLENVLEGAFRPGHFNGVGIVVSKLFHHVQPTVAYFGQKDLQQTLVIKRMVADLGFPIKIVIADICREQDGLAMSSRNVRLTPKMREIAPLLYKSISIFRERVQHGVSIQKSREEAVNFLQDKEIRLEYLEIAETSSLSLINDTYQGEVAICIAAYLGEVRLIDNVVFQKLK